MYYENHLDIIKEGITAWNEWRMNDPTERIDLRKANLRDADLRKANLRDVDLRGADLSGADLFGANLSGADLRKANLFEADLFGANLVKANLFEANLSGNIIGMAWLFRADLRKADLHKTFLLKANLGGAKLRDADLHEADLRKANLSGASLFQANLTGANLFRANLSGADLRKANLFRADLREANLYEADLSKANLNNTRLGRAKLIKANLDEADLRDADLSEADLSRASLVNTNFEKANLNGCRIYGISAWNLKLGKEKENNLTFQDNLIVTPEDEPIITVDNIEVAQFVYLLSKNEKIRDVIDTITSKVVLILGRFTPERKEILDALRKELRNRGYSPVLFDFEKPASRDLMETVTLLARMAKFIIADITDAKSIPAELERIVPDLPSVPIQPLILRSDYEYALFEHIKHYPWVLKEFLYDTHEGLLAVLGKAVISPVEKKSQEIREKSSRN